MKKKLATLSALGGVSGFEYELGEQVSAFLQPYCKKVWQDRMGNYYR